MKDGRQHTSVNPCVWAHVEEVIANEETVKSSQKTAEGVWRGWGSSVSLSELM